MNVDWLAHAAAEESDGVAAAAAKSKPLERGVGVRDSGRESDDCAVGTRHQSGRAFDHAAVRQLDGHGSQIRCLPVRTDIGAGGGPSTFSTAVCV